jgi:hypothetical protein
VYTTSRSPTACWPVNLFCPRSSSVRVAPVHFGQTPSTYLFTYHTRSSYTSSARPSHLFQHSTSLHNEVNVNVALAQHNFRFRPGMAPASIFRNWAFIECGPFHQIIVVVSLARSRIILGPSGGPVSSACCQEVSLARI